MPAGDETATSRRPDRWKGRLTELGIRWLIPSHDEVEPATAHRMLHERVKELNCLYAISQLTDRSHSSMDDLLAEIVDVLPASWQYPAIACAEIVFRARTYRSRYFVDPGWRQSAEIRVDGEPAGSVSIIYNEKRPEEFEGPFLREERALLDAIAERLGSLARHVSDRLEIQETNRQLMMDRRALHDANVALRTVLARIQEEKDEIHSRINQNVGRILMPILHALALESGPRQKKYVDLLRDNLENITSAFVTRLSAKSPNLSPTEIRICDMIRSGLSSKDIAELRGVSVATIHRHRENIRRKLGITNSRVNLATHLENQPRGRDE